MTVNFKNLNFFFFIFRNEDFLEELIIFMHQFINSKKIFQKFKSVLNILSSNEILKSFLIDKLIESIEERLQASEWKELRICFGLEEEQTSSTYQVETTTEGIAFTSLASIKIVFICISLPILSYLM